MFLYLQPKTQRLSGRGRSGVGRRRRDYSGILISIKPQTRLGTSSLRNVSEGSTITHNKWAYANTGLFVMHKSLFGAHGGDAVC